MSQVTDIKEQIKDLYTFKHISSAFTEAAAVKLRNIRQGFIRNDRFFEEISYIYHLVEMHTQQAKLSSRNLQENTAPKKLSVAFTSNQRFFGTINNEVMIRFLSDSKKFQTGRLVLGVTGISYLHSIDFREHFSTLQFASDLPNQQETFNFLNMIADYDQVTIYFPRFISFLKQEVASLDLTRKIPLASEKEKNRLKQELNPIFEPDLPKMNQFFNSQVRNILFKRVLLETDLARTAARLLNMSQAEDRTDFEITVKKTELNKVLRSVTNAQLLETFSGIKKWKHGISNRRSVNEMKNKLLFLESSDQNVN